MTTVLAVEQLEASGLGQATAQQRGPGLDEQWVASVHERLDMRPARGLRLRADVHLVALRMPSLVDEDQSARHEDEP